MAIISSVALGKAQKSLGNVTFQHYYGKTVAKQKVVRNPNYKPSTKQELQRARMYFAFKFANAWDGLSDMLFVRSKWGTKRNNFLKLNYPAIADYVNAHENLTLPQSGAYLSLLYSLINDFSAYNKPVYAAKGIDAGINCYIHKGDYAEGKSPFSFNLTVTDALYKKIRFRLLYFIGTETTAPYTGQTPLNSTTWYDLTLASGIWTSGLKTFDVSHTVNQTLGFIFDIEIDDTPCTINVTGASADPEHSGAGIISLVL